MKTCLLITLLLFLALPEPAGAQPAVALDTYVNPRFQYAIKYPINILIPQGEADNGDGQRFVSPDGGAVLTVWGSHNALEQTLQDKFRESRQSFGGRVTYQVMKRDWFVFSGVKNGRIFYQKTYLSNDVFKSFTLEYPVEQRGRFDPITEAISSSFTGR